MYENNPSNSEYPEVTPDPSTIEQPADQKRAVATAAGGTIVLGAAAYGLSLLDDSNSEPVEDNSSAQAAADAADARAQASALPLVTPVGDPMNTSLENLDSLTFDEAFAAARHQLGAGHHFTWHNGLYNTYYEPELDDLSRADRLAFMATLPNAGGMKSPADGSDDAPRMAAAHHEGNHPHKATAILETNEPVVDREAVAEIPEPKVADNVVTVIPMAATVPTLVPLAHAVDTVPASQTPAANPMPTPVHNDDFASQHTGSIEHSALDAGAMHEHTDHDVSHLPDGDALADAHHLGD